MKRTKIVCTIGPASERQAVLVKMIKAGMNVARLNFSHGQYRNHALLIKNVRAAATATGVSVAILQDLQGPRIRTGEIPSPGITLKKGGHVILVPEADFRRRATGDVRVPIQHPAIAQDVKPGDRILISDGLFELRVERVERKARHIHCTVVRGGVVTSHRGMNLPGVKLRIATITPKDKADLAFGLKQGVDWVALSFVRGPEDVVALKRLMKRFAPGKKTPATKVIAKIERLEAVEKIDEIIAVADGIMVARGDLGIELPPERVPLIQKKLIQHCLVAGKPVIVATQMLESMITNPRPTRAEVSDVANAVIDHTDAVMLSAESATGQYPLEAVQVMADTITRMESSPLDNQTAVPHFRGDGSTAASIGEAVSLLVKKTKAVAVVVLTRSGRSARMISRCRPEVPIVALTVEETTRRQLALVWGVTAYRLRATGDANAIFRAAERLVQQQGFAESGDRIVITSGYPLSQTGELDLVKVHEVR